MTSRLSSAEISRIRDRLLHYRTGDLHGDDAALADVLARDSCALSAHCADIEEERAPFVAWDLQSNATYYKRVDGAWGLNDPDCNDTDEPLTRLEAIRRARAFGSEAERPYAPATEEAVQAIAARAGDFLQPRSAAARSELARQLVADLPVLLDHAAALDDDFAVFKAARLPHGTSVGRDQGADTFGYFDLAFDALATGLGFEEAFRRAAILSQLHAEYPDGQEDADYDYEKEPAWLRADRAARDARSKAERAEKERRRAQAEAASAEEERRKAEQEELVYRSLKVTSYVMSRRDPDRQFGVSQGPTSALVTLRPRCAEASAPPWSATIAAHFDDIQGRGGGDTPEAALAEAIVRVRAFDPRYDDFGHYSLGGIEWDAVPAKIMAHGPFRSAEEVFRTAAEHDDHLQDLARKIRPDIERLLAEHGLALDAVGIEDDEGKAEIRLELKWEASTGLGGR